MLLRHGETEWSKAMKHTGLTDIDLTSRGEELAVRTRPLLKRFRFAAVYVSPLRRAQRTAELVGLKDAVVERNLLEWDYGGYEGRTTAEIRKELGHDWTVFNDGVVPGETPGETVEQVAARASQVLAKVRPDLERGDVLLFGHGHALRVLAATYLREQIRFGAKLLLDAGSFCVLTVERGEPAISKWNARGGLKPLHSAPPTLH